MSLLASFEGLKSFKPKIKECDIDNFVFKLHYRFTVLALLAGTILVTSRQYIGEHIRCICGAGVPENVINTYCFFTTTFSVVKSLNSSQFDRGIVPHPGVGPFSLNSGDTIQKHAYYQWVPFVLFGQAFMFYTTHLIWKKIEGCRLKNLVNGLRFSAFSVTDKAITVTDTKLGEDKKPITYNIPPKEEREKQLQVLRKIFIDRLYISGNWSMGLMFCEVLNLLHVLLQFYLTNLFLNNLFFNLGPDVIREGLESSVNPLEDVFPKVTKCHFHKYGPSGTIQIHDAMCVMALNIINEQIYIFLWFWFLILFIMSALALLWRAVSIVFHSRSRIFNKYAFTTSCPGKMNPWKTLRVSKHYSYTDWLFLKYLAKNLDPLVFKELILGLAEQLDKKEFLIDDNDYSL